MKKIFASGLVLSLCVVMAGCDSVGTSEAKRDAKAVDKSYEAQADLVEAVARNAPHDAAEEAKARADALRNKGEAIKDHLISEAEQAQHDTRKVD
ncbi:MAG TPA: hypothetical protein VNS79_02525 [Sphingobium sp.]|nr:hypothetical protein [Sphingobium sp.]